MIFKHNNAHNADFNMKSVPNIWHLRNTKSPQFINFALSINQKNITNITNAVELTGVKINLKIMQNF